MRFDCSVYATQNGDWHKTESVFVMWVWGCACACVYVFLLVICRLLFLSFSLCIVFKNCRITFRVHIESLHINVLCFMTHWLRHACVLMLKMLTDVNAFVPAIPIWRMSNSAYIQHTISQAMFTHQTHMIASVLISSWKQFNCQMNHRMLICKIFRTDRGRFKRHLTKDKPKTFQRPENSLAHCAVAAKSSI